MRLLFAILLTFPIFSFAQTGTWGVTYLPEAATELISASTKTKAYFLHKYNANNPSSVLYVYDERSNSWSTDSIPIRVAYPYIGALGSKFYVCGDTAWHKQSSLIQIFDESTGLWSTSNLSYKRSDGSISSVGSKIYFCGGGQAPGNGFNYGTTIIDVYDTLSGTWSVINMLNGRLYHSSYSTNDKLFIAGGQWAAPGGGSLPLNILDVSTNLWTAYSPNPSITSNFCIGGILNKVFIGKPQSNNFEMYDINSNQWLTGNFQYSRNSIKATTGSDRVFFNGDNGYLDVYYAPTDSFYIDSLPLHRSKICLASVNGKVMFAGGTLTNGQPTTHVDIFYDSTATISLKENIAQQQLTIFPNPCSNFITLENNFTIDKIEVFDMLGKEVKSVKNINSKHIEINTSELKQGVYLFKISSEHKVEFKKVNIINYY